MLIPSMMATTLHVTRTPGIPQEPATQMPFHSIATMAITHSAKVANAIIAHPLQVPLNAAAA